MPAFFAYGVGMEQITVRKVDSRCVEEARRLAKLRGISMNTVYCEVLEKGLGSDGGAKTNGLERFAADSDFGEQWDSHLEELRQVNLADWE